MTRARFWTTGAQGNPVKITLRPGETLRHYRFSRDEEGWSSASDCYYHAGDHIECEWTTDGVDCDGRLSRAGVSICAISDLAAGYKDAEAGVTWPDWKAERESQRDYAAEAMGF